MKKIVVAGATGNLGKFLLYKLKNKGYETIALARNTRKLEGIPTDGIIKAEVTQPITLDGKFNGVDCVISTVGITRQKDGLTYMDVERLPYMKLAETRTDLLIHVNVALLKGGI